jgi:hypothetical protein
MGMMHEATGQLVEGMKDAAVSGQTVDMSSGMGNMSLKIIGQSAFG